MIRKVLIAVCVVFLLATGVNQYRQAQEQRSSHQQFLSEQHQKTLLKREEVMQQLESVQAKPNPTDHDRWLIAHLTKIADGLDVALATMDTGQQRIERESVRTWVGMGGIFLALVVLFLGFTKRSDVRLTDEERDLLQRSLATIDGIRLDAGSYRPDSAPVSSSSNFVTGRIRQQDMATLKIRGGWTMKAFAGAFIIAPLFYLAVDVGYLVSDVLERGMDAEFSMINDSLVMVASFGLGVLMLLVPRLSSITVDRQLQLVRFPGDNAVIPFADIASIQLNDILVTGERTFRNHQIQLNLKNGEARSLLNHAGEEQMKADLIRLARFTGLPIAVPAV